MAKYLEDFLFFIGLLVIIFIIDYFFINKRKLNQIENKKQTKKGKKKIKSIGELDYLVTKFKLDSNLINKDKAIIWFSLINSFIISFTSCLIVLIPMKLIWQLLIAFALLFGLIYSLYEIYGRHLKNKELKIKNRKSE